MLIIANWKMYRALRDSIKTFRELDRGLVDVGKSHTVVVAASLGVLAHPEMQSRKVKIAAQNCHWQQVGQFTGEESPRTLRELKCKYVLVGHSDRREQFDEDDQMVHDKVKAVLHNGMKAVLCVGEPSLIREKGGSKRYVLSQIGKALEGVSKVKLKDVIIAYEPVWAISPGGPAEPVDAFVMAKLIRDFINKKFGERYAKKVKILYGGSVNKANVKSFTEENVLDGFLVGRASLHADSLLGIIEKC